MAEAIGPRLMIMVDLASIRALVRSRVYVALAALTMGVGIGGTLSLFAALDVPLWRPLPFPAGDRIVVIQPVTMDSGAAVGRLPGPYADAVLRHRGLELVSFARQLTLRPNFEEGADTWMGVAVSENALELLGFRAILGRGLVADDFASAEETPVLISWSLWASRFGRDPLVLQKRIECEDQSVRVVGVYSADALVPTFPHAMRPQVLLPLRISERDILREGVVAPFARIRHNSTIADVRAEMGVQLGLALQRHPPPFNVAGVKISPLREYLYSVHQHLYTLMGYAAVAMLIIVWMNSASLLVARVRHRGHEWAIRQSLGAGRVRIAAQLAGENVLLGACAVPIGLVVALWISSYLSRAAPEGIAVAVSPIVDARTCAAGIAIGLLIVSMITAVAVPEALRNSNGPVNAVHIVAGRSGYSWRQPVIAVQVSVVLALMIGTGLMAHTVVRLAHLPSGASVDEVLLFRPRLPYSRYSGAQAKEFWQQLLLRIEGHPRIASGAVAFSVPMIQNTPWASLVGTDGTDWTARGAMVPVSRGYFATLRIPLINGRTFTEQEDRSSALVGVVNETAARAYWPGESPLGKVLYTHWCPEPYLIIGVAGDTRFSPDMPDVPTMYVPVWRQRALRLMLLLRTHEGPRDMTPWIASQVRQLEPQAVIPQAEKYAEAIERWRQRPRFLATILACFAAIALGITAAGTAAVVSYAVFQRFREMGIRVALGATRSDIHRMVLKRLLAASLAGVAAGISMGAVFGRMLQHELFEVTVLDPTAYFVATAVILVVMCVAGYVPARYAGRVDPCVILRQP